MGRAGLSPQLHEVVVTASSACDAIDRRILQQLVAICGELRQRGTVAAAPGRETSNGQQCNSMNAPIGRSGQADIGQGWYGFEIGVGPIGRWFVEWSRVCEAHQQPTKKRGRIFQVPS